LEIRVARIAGANDGDGSPGRRSTVDPFSTACYIAATHRAAAGASERLALRALVAGLALQLAFGLVFAWGTVVPFVRSQEHWPAVLLGAVFSATPLGYGTGTLLGGRLADRLPPRRLCWAALGLLALGLGVAFLFPSGFTFVVFYAGVALGLGGGVALTGAVAAATQVYPRHAGGVGGALTAAYAAAAIFEAPLIALLAPRLGWLGALRLVAVTVAVVAALGLTLMPNLPRARRHPDAPQPVGQLQLLRRPLIWSGGLVILLGATLGPYAAVNLVADANLHRLAPWLGTAGLVGFSFGNAFSRLAAGLAADRLGVDPVVLVVLGLDLLTAGLLWSSSTPLTILLAGLAAGTALGSAAGVLSRMARNAAPDAPNTAFGILFAAYAVGAVVGPLLGAVVGGSAAWLAVGAPALAGLAVLAGRRRLRTAAHP